MEYRYLFEDCFYRIDEFGNIYGRNGGIMKLRAGVDPQLYIRGKLYKVESLVAKSFCNGYDENTMKITHIDGDKTNNHYTNLRFEQLLYNERHLFIGGFEKYMVSEHGDVFSLATKKYLAPSEDTDGYYKVGLSKDGVCTTFFVHRIVASTFLKKPDGCNVVNHIDSDRKNNYYKNLEWTTPKGNFYHGIKFGNVKLKGESNPNSKLTYEDVLEIRRMYENNVRISEIQKQYNNVTWENIKHIVERRTFK